MFLPGLAPLGVVNFPSEKLSPQEQEEMEKILEALEKRKKEVGAEIADLERHRESRFQRFRQSTRRGCDKSCSSDS